MKNLRYLRIVFYLLLSIMLLTGCQKNQAEQASSTQSSFDKLTNQIFLDHVQSDSITLNYTVSDKNKYGIKDYVPTLGNYSVEEMKKGLTENENYLSLLDEVDESQLNHNQEITYDILKKSFEHSLSGSDFLLYNENLGPTTGFQAQLPVLLAEYNFYTKKDIEDYISVLNCVKGYMENIVSFEKSKADHGLFMNQSTADQIIAQCKKFIEKPDENLLISVFNQKMDSFSGLTNEEKESFKQKNKEVVLQSVVPGYNTLIDGLNSLIPQCKVSGGLSNYPNGNKYYEYLIKGNTGSTRSMDEINLLLDKYIKESQVNILTLLSKDSNIYYQALSPSYPITEPKATINYLKDAISLDFPTISPVNCTIKYVDQSLQDYLSPAFYLTPAIDNFSENSIYINKGRKNDMSDLFTTLAHEGYPGHLYQSVYYEQQNPSPVRSVLNFGGYTEGWATYVELYSYHISGINSNVSDLLENNMIATLCVYGKADIGINYYSWSLADTKKFLSQYGISDDKSVNTIYQNMIDEPGNYMKYVLGYIEIKELRTKAENALGNRFNLKDFHTFLLNMGPGWFDVIDKYMDEWISSYKK